MQKIDTIPSQPTDDDQSNVQGEYYLNASDRSGLSDAQQEQTNQKQQTVRKRDIRHNSMATETVGDQLQTIKGQADKLPAAAGAKLLGADPLVDAIKEASNTRNVIDLLKAGASEDLSLLAPLLAIATLLLGLDAIKMIELTLPTGILTAIACVIYVFCLVWIGYKAIYSAKTYAADRQKWEDLLRAAEKKMNDLNNEIHANHQKINDLNDEIHANQDTNREFRRRSQKN